MSRAIGIAAPLLAALSSVAAAERLDDSFSPQSQYAFDFEWAQPSVGAAAGDARLFRQQAQVQAVEIRLDTSQFLDRSAQVFLALPAQVPGLAGSGGLRLTWETRGTLAAGSTTPGARALLFDGVISEEVIVEFFDFTLEVEAAELRGALRVDPVFEIEVR